MIPMFTVIIWFIVLKTYLESLKFLSYNRVPGLIAADKKRVNKDKMIKIKQYDLIEKQKTNQTAENDELFSERHMQT